MKVILAATALMVGCAQLPASLGDLRIDESSVQSVVKTQLVDKGPLPLANSSAADLSILIRDIDLDLVSAGGGRVVASMDTELTTDVPFIGQIKTQLAPRISGGIELRGQSIYLVSPRLESLGYEGPYGQAIEQTLGDQGQRLSAALDLYFSQTPIYNLNDDPRLALASQVMKTVKIDDGGISLSP